MDNQQQYNSVMFGMTYFFPVTGKAVNTKCKHCILQRSDTDCVEAPCSPGERKDGQHGYYSIHEMPKP